MEKDGDDEGCDGVCDNDAEDVAVAAAEPLLDRDPVHDWVAEGEGRGDRVEVWLPVLDGLRVQVWPREIVAVGEHDLVGPEGVGVTVGVGDSEPVWLALKVSVDVEVKLGPVAVPLRVGVPVPVGECTEAVTEAVVGVGVPREGENEAVEV